MRRKGRPLHAHEKDLWHRVARSVNPMKPNVTPPEPPPTKTGPAKPSAPISASPRPAPYEHKQSQPGLNLDGSTQRKLRRGRAEIDAKIDLHGMRQAEAHAALNRFIMGAQSRGARCVLVITGKGTRGEAHSNPYETRGPGVLRTRLRQWLAQEPLRAMVFGIEEAHPRHGGAGAFYVFIRKK